MISRQNELSTRWLLCIKNMTIRVSQFYPLFPKPFYPLLNFDETCNYIHVGDQCWHRKFTNIMIPPTRSQNCHHHEVYNIWISPNLVFMWNVNTVWTARDETSNEKFSLNERNSLHSKFYLLRFTLYHYLTMVNKQVWIKWHLNMAGKWINSDVLVK